MRTIFSLAVSGWLMLAAPAHAQAGDDPQAIDIPADSDISLETRLLQQMNRDVLKVMGADPRNARAVAMVIAEKLPEAEALYRAIIAEELGEPDRYAPYVASMEMNLALVLQRQHRYAEAEQTYRRALDRVEERPRTDETVYLTAMNLGGLLLSQGRFDEAEPLLRQAVAGTSIRRKQGSGHSLSAQIGLGYILFARHKTGELATLLRSVNAQIGRYNYGGTEQDFRLRRLQCLAAGTCRISETELRAEAGETMKPASSLDSSSAS